MDQKFPNGPARACPETPITSASDKLSGHLKRTPATWIAYLTLVYFALILNCLGPVTSLIRTEQQLSYSQAGTLGSSFASGLVVVSLLTVGINRRFGAWRTLSLACVGLLFGSLLICLARDFIVILIAAFLAGTFGSLIIREVPLLLAREHEQRSTAAVTEANALASASAILGPGAIGLAERLDVGWRWAFLAPFLLVLAAAGIFALVQPKIRPSNQAAHLHNNRFGRGFWLTWWLLFFSVAAEFTVIFWATDSFREGGLSDRGQANQVLVLFFAAMCIGRAVGSEVTRRISSVAVLFASLAIALFGSVFYCLTVPIPSRLIGLALLGLGIANLYPTFLSLLISNARPYQDKASAKATLASGLAILVFPFVLGKTADLTSLTQAQLLIPSLLVGILFIFIYSLQLETKP